MPSSPGQQLEKLINQVLKSNDYQALYDFLQEDIDEGTTFKCSKHFFTRLDTLVNKALDQKDAKHASLALSILSKYGKKLSPPGGQGLSGMVAQGLVKKWFEKCRQLWIQGGPKRDGMLLNVAEDFFDSLMVVHAESKEGTYEITQFLLYPIGQLATDPRIYILIQKEAIRKLNIILDKIPVELRKEKKILSSQEASDIMVKLAGHILDCGDYDLQIALMESLARMTTPGQRKELADQWFTMEYVASAFINIKDSEFETDCRKFLNLVNGMHGDKRRVYSYPCLEAFLGKNELLMPSDEKLEEFWIDFNLGSQSISFYYCLAGMEAEGEWDTICVTENEVENYTIADQGRSSVLKINLSECIEALEGTSLTIHFNSLLDILQAACSVYGSLKNKSVIGKKSSVVKTTVKIIMDDSCSQQQTVPESQASAGGDKETERNSTPCLLPPPAVPNNTSVKKRVWESATFITSSSKGSVSSVSPFSSIFPGTTPSKWKVKGTLEMTRSSEKQDQFNPGVLGMRAKTSGHGVTPSSTITESVRQQTDTSLHSKVSKPTLGKKHIPVAEVVKAVLAEQEEEQGPLDQSFVPDSQPNTKLERNILPWRKNSVSEMLMMPTQRNSSLQQFQPGPSLKQQEQHPSSAQRTSLPESGPLSHKLLHKELTQRLQALSEMSQSTEPQELAKSKRTTPQTSEKPFSKDSTDERGSTRCAPKKPQQQQGEKQHLTKRSNTKHQEALVSDSALTKATVKPTSTKVLQDIKTPSTKLKDSGTISSKEKRAAEVVDSMVREISSHYDKTTSSTVAATTKAVTPHWIPKPDKKSMFNSWLPTAKKETPRSLLIKSFSDSRKTSNTQRDDVFAFHGDTLVPATKFAESSARKCSGFQDSLSQPTTTKKERVLKGTGKKSTESSAKESSGFQDSYLQNSSTTKKGQPLAKEKRYVKKHLFSDTDTIGTEDSWVKDSCRKPKPKVIQYTRQLPSKTKARAPDATSESSDFPPPSPKPVREKYKQNEKRPSMKATADHRMEKQAVSHRPQRAVATNRKSYRELDTDESQSDSEQKCVREKTAKVRKSTAGNKPTKTYCERDQEGQAESEQPAAEAKVRKRTAGNNPTKTYWERDQDGQAESEQPAAEAKMRKNTSGGNKPNKTYCERDQDSQSESEQPPGPKEKSEKTWREAAEVKKRNNSAPSKQFSTTYRESITDSRSEQAPTTNKYVMEKSKKMGEEAEAKRRKSAATKKSTKSYGESDHDSQSESEQLLCLKKHTIMQTCKTSPESSESKKKKIPSTKEQMNSKLTSFTWNAYQKMRSAEGSTPTQARRPLLSPLGSPLPAIATTPCKYSPSPVLDLPKLRCSPISRKEHFQPSSIYSTGKKTMRLYLPELSPIQPTLSPAPMSPFSQDSQPPLASTALDLEVWKSVMPSPPQVELSQNGLYYGSGMESVSQVSLSQSSFSSNKTSVPISRLNIKSVTAAVTLPKKIEETPSSDKENSTDQQQYHMSGPSRKRQTAPLVSSSSEEEEKEEGRKVKNRGQCSARMKPKKLFKSNIDESPEGEVSQKVSHMASSRRWETQLEGDDDIDMDAEVPDINPSDMGTMCRELGSELKMKYQNRSRRIQSYTKQSLKMTQQHMSSLTMQAREYRTRRLQNVQQVLVEEMNNLEQDDVTLKNMEKEFTTYWKKQSMAFHTYHESGTQRLTTLKTTLQSDVCHSVEYEEKTFTTQMCLMRKDMKSLQDKLLTEMHEEELQNVKRGLQALFLPGGAMF